MSDTVRSCPVCGGELPSRTTGRPAVYCSKRCRQAASRAKIRARNAADHATRLRAHMVADLDEALSTLDQARVLLAGPVREHPRRTAAAVTAGGEGWHASPPTGWEPPAQELVQTLARRIRRVEGYLREHARAAVEHDQSMRVAGIRRPPGE